MANAFDAAHQHRNIGYIRQSVSGPHIIQLTGKDYDTVHTDKADATSTDRPAWRKCLAELNPDDSLHVQSMDRVANTVSELHSVVMGVIDKGASLYFDNEGWTVAARGDIRVRMLAELAKMEKNAIKDKHYEGVQRAQSRGAYGHHGKEPLLTSAQAAEVLAMDEMNVPKAEIAKRFGVTRQTIWRYLKKYGSDTGA